MKKTYIAPGMVIVKVQTAAGMLAGSPTMDIKSGTVGGNQALSRERGGNFWDDDEEDY